ncbi:hypothetical protein M427DRAFT_475985 [Gonapodya prolifera JEL478]|uniref:Transmembrane 6 superfamily member 1/2 transmembrane domain-containing protein n=1 Tax=Gonapodya prolifera (strain JEL478) TaxID=1344416 RepID=A0A139A1S4_GONPJ|nr:hypothetical protein M427DRAFT_475985 [Gonapodya prolifera JEL478]|eukprot:KXS10588.1 hypothetical protein M427DRAFT_475985 [Gonapodya prolifera JEL478]
MQCRRPVALIWAKQPPQGATTGHLSTWHQNPPSLLVMAPSTHPNPIPPLVATILISLSAVPCLYYAPMLFPDSDTTELSNGATVLPFVAFATMAFAIGGLAAVAIKPYKNESDSSWYLYMFSFMGFTSVVDLVLSLGALGLVDLGTFYLRSEERHHSSSHGAFLCFWDGIFQFSCHLSFVYGLVVEGGAFWQHKGYRAVVWWWLASIFNS